MARRHLYAVLVLGLAGLACLDLPATQASKTRSSRSRGSHRTTSLQSARLLASHGEPGRALERLRSGGGRPTDESDALAASLFAQLGEPAAAESILARMPSGAGNREEEFRSHLVRARLSLDAGRYDAALEHVATIEGIEGSPYTAYRDYIAARARFATGDAAGAAQVLERARARAPEALRSELELARVEVYRSLGRTGDALAAGDDAVAGALSAAEKRRLLEARVDVALALGERPEARKTAARLFDEAGRSSEAEACAVQLVTGGVAKGGSADFLLACARVLHARGRTGALHVALRWLDGRSLSPAQREEHRLLWGEYHYLNRDASRALALARPAYRDPELRRRSMLLMARSYRRAGRGEDAARTYEQYASEFPNDAMAPEVLYAAAALYHDLHRDDDRVRVIDQLRHAYPSAFHGWAASMARARELAGAGEHADAAAIYEQWLTRSRRTDEAALYYLARERRAAGDGPAGAALLDELHDVNPFSFYANPDVPPPRSSGASGGAAADAAGVDAWLADVTSRRNQAYDRVRSTVMEAGDDAGASLDARMALERGRCFLAAGIRDWGERELEVARVRGAESSMHVLLLARLFEEHAMPWHSVRLYERTRAAIPWDARRERVDDLRYLTHPIPFPVQVFGAAAREEIAPYLLYGMMREESGFDADVVSRAGAVGLMQLMPETARVVARRLVLTPDVDDRLGDPAVNVSIGSWYAADLLRDGKGSVAWMLAAYNAGPGAADQWIEPGMHGEAAIGAVDSIDYRETRGYVKRVVESANVYRALYFDHGGNGAGSPR